MANIYDSANELEREIRELPEFKSLEAAFAELKKNETAYAALRISKHSNKACRKNKCAVKTSAMKMHHKHKH